MDKTAPAPKKPDKLALVLRRILIGVGVAILLGIGLFAYSYASTPPAVRDPKSTHYHLRLQIINGGNSVNFSESKFQTPFNKDMCSAELTKEPVHFHDGLDQFLHVHWTGVTGGMMLKSYGWNFIGGPDDTLGYKYNNLPKMEKVGIHGESLPKPPDGAKYFVYVGDADNFKEVPWNDFLKTELKDIFSGATPTASNWLIPAAYAHEGHDHETGSKVDLVKLNNLVGNAVIFAQRDKPTDPLVRNRFKNLVPLPESSCAG